MQNAFLKHLMNKFYITHDPNWSHGSVAKNILLFFFAATVSDSILFVLKDNTTGFLLKEDRHLAFIWKTVEKHSLLVHAALC